MSSSSLSGSIIFAIGGGVYILSFALLLIGYKKEKNDRYGYMLAFVALAFLYACFGMLSQIFSGIRGKQNYAFIFYILTQILMIHIPWISLRLINVFLDFPGKIKLLTTRISWAFLAAALMTSAALLLLPASFTEPGKISPSPFTAGGHFLFELRNALIFLSILYIAFAVLFYLRKHPIDLSQGFFLTGLAAFALFGIGEQSIHYLSFHLGFFPEGEYPRGSIGFTVFILLTLCSLAVTIYRQYGGPDGKKDNPAKAGPNLLHIDFSTGLPNRRSFEEALERLLIRMRQQKRHRNNLLFYIDIDDFKTLKASLGNKQEDELLHMLIGRISENLHESDSLYRFGADEFMLIVHDLPSASDGAILAMKLIEAANRVVRIGGSPVYSSISIGITRILHDGERMDILLRNAHNALLEAKKEKNTYCFYSPSLANRAMEKLKIIANLRAAIAAEDLTVVYQPIVSGEGKILRAEALVRWTDPELGSVSPEIFIPVAEEFQLMPVLGELILKRILDDLYKTRLQGQIKISVNLSTQQLGGVHLLEILDREKEIKGYSSDDIQFEITETAMLNNREGNLTTLRGLRNRGFSLALDDFGTGYSSLSYLHDLPVDTIKIDRSFIENIPEDRKNTVLLQAIISLSKELDLSIVAEGVETESQFRFLKEAGCDLFQGYYFSEPVDTEELKLLCLEGVAVS